MTNILFNAHRYNTGLTADQDGVYELRLKFNGHVFALQETLQSGDAIGFYIGTLNEDYIYTCTELIAPDGAITVLEPIKIRVAL